MINFISEVLRNSYLPLIVYSLSLIVGFLLHLLMFFNQQHSFLTRKEYKFHLSCNFCISVCCIVFMIYSGFNPNSYIYTKVLKPTAILGIMQGFGIGCIYLICNHIFGCMEGEEKYDKY